MIVLNYVLKACPSVSIEMLELRFWQPSAWPFAQAQISAYASKFPWHMMALGKVVGLF